MTNHELKLYQVWFDTLKGLGKFFTLKQLILVSDKLFETGRPIIKTLKNMILFSLLRSQHCGSRKRFIFMFACLEQLIAMWNILTYINELLPIDFH